MCSFKPNANKAGSNTNITQTIAHINGPPVLQPTSNQVPCLGRRKSLKKIIPKSPMPLPVPLPLSGSSTANVKATKPSSSPPISPKLKSPRPPAVKRGKDSNELNSSSEKVVTPRCSSKLVDTVKKSKSFTDGGAATFVENSLKYSSSSIVDAPGSIAAARREQAALMQQQRKMRIAHYGRTKSAKYEGKAAGLDLVTSTVSQEKKRCSFITPNSDPIFVAYHDEEWGVPVHDDKLLFELLVLTGAQVGSDRTSLLKKRQVFREAFSEFDAEVVTTYSEKKIVSISADYGLDISQVRAVVDNSNRILQVKKELGSFDKYLWGFVNDKSIVTQYKTCHKIPVKTSKSESMSKDMVKRGFRFVGPTVIHSFMQAAGLTNDHLTTCPRHLECVALAKHNFNN